MAKSQIVNSGTVGVNDNVTTYFPIVGQLIANTNEDQIEIPIRDAGNFSDFYTRVVTNTASVSSVFTFRLSRAGTTLAITYTSDETGVKEDTDVVAAAATDEVDYQLVIPTEAGTNTLTFTVIGVSFTPTTSTDTVTLLGAVGSNGYNGTSVTDFEGVLSTLSEQTEAQTRVAIRGSFALKNFYVFVISNARATSNITFRTRVDGGNGASEVVYAATETGAKEDTDTDNVTTGQLIAYSIEQGAEAANTIASVISCTCLSTSSEFPLMGGTAMTQNFNVTNYIGVSGRNSQVTTTETERQIVPNFTFSAKNLNANVTANTIATSASTVTFRVAAGPGNGILSYAAAETGVKVDTDSDVVTADTTAIDYEIMTPNTSGAITFRNISCTGIVASGASLIKTINGLAIASVKEVNALANASMKTFNGLANT